MKNNIIFCLLLGVSLAVQAQIPTDGLVRFYPFNGNTDDASIGSKHGTVYGANLTFDRFGTPDAAYAFKSSEGDYIDIPFDGLDYQEFTVAHWVSLHALPASIGSVSMSISYGAPAGDQSMYYVRDFSEEHTGFAMSSYSTVSPNSYTSVGTDATIGLWQHVAFTRDAQIIRFYINGIKIDSIPIEHNAFYGNGTRYARIGARYNLTQHFDGAVDEVRIYERSLSEQEIFHLYFGENQCIDKISVTDTLIINANLSGTVGTVPNYYIKVYPNPTKDHITIDFGNLNTLNGYAMRITNAAEQEVYTSGTITQPSAYLNLSNWTGLGTYFIYLYDPSGNLVEVKKLILQ